MLHCSTEIISDTVDFSRRNLTATDNLATTCTYVVARKVEIILLVIEYMNDDVRCVCYVKVMFEPYLKNFYIRSNDSTHVKLLKVRFSCMFVMFVFASLVFSQLVSNCVYRA